MARLSDQEREARERLIQSYQAQANESGDTSGWFEALYSAATRGETTIPWEDGTTNPHLLAWLEREAVDGTGRRALEVGTGYGHGAIALAQRGFEVTAVELSSSAVALAKATNPHERIDYRQQDMLELPDDFVGAFDLVVEIYTLQAIQKDQREILTSHLPRTVAPGGTLLVVCRARDEEVIPTGPPWALAESEVRALAYVGSGLEVVHLERFLDGESPPKDRFLAVLQKKSS